MKDRMVLQRTLVTAARVQARADYICMRRKSGKTEVAQAAAQDVVAKYPPEVAADVVEQRTGASPKAAAKAVKEAQTALDFNLGRVNVADPQWRFEERVKALTDKGVARAEAEKTVKTVIATKELTPLVIPGREVALEDIPVGQRFRCAMKPHFDFAGVVLYKTPARVSVLLDAGAVQTREFVSGGKTVTFESSSRTRRNMAPDTLVTALKETEDLSLLLGKDQVQKKSSSIQDQTEAIMAAGKKAKAKKTNGSAEAKPSKRAEFAAKTIKVLAEKNPKREGSASFKRFALYKSGMTVGAFVEKGGTLGDVHYDTAHKYISVS